MMLKGYDKLGEGRLSFKEFKSVFFENRECEEFSNLSLSSTGTS